MDGQKNPRQKRLRFAKLPHHLGQYPVSKGVNLTIPDSRALGSLPAAPGRSLGLAPFLISSFSNNNEAHSGSGSISRCHIPARPSWAVLDTEENQVA